LRAEGGERRNFEGNFVLFVSIYYKDLHIAGKERLDGVRVVYVSAGKPIAFLDIKTGI